MKKRVLSIFLSLLMLLPAFTACGSEPDSETKENGPVTETTPQTEAMKETGRAEETDPSVPAETDTPVVSELRLVEEGASGYVIVRGVNAAVAEITAAEELQVYLGKITGVTIPIVTDETATVDREIVVGRTNREPDGMFDRDELGTDGFVIRTEGETVWLVGGEKRGTLYAVYEFLEAYLGCRFYTAEIEKIPEMTTLALAPIPEDKQIPVFMDRKGASNGDAEGDLSAKWRLTNTIEKYGGDVSWATWVHTHFDLVSPDLYFESNPEYFSLDENGERVAEQLCLTNPEVLAIATESTRNILAARPSTDIISISQMDNHVYCHCADCQAVYNAEGSYMGTVLAFVNSIAEELKDEFPDVLFETIAYFYSRNIPANIRPLENVLIRLCSIECCFNHPLSECGSGAGAGAMVKQSFGDDIRDWSSVTDKLFIWDYTVNFMHYLAPHPNFDILLDNARFFAENNVIGVYESGKSREEGHKGEFHALRLYLLAKVMWDPYMTEEEYYGYMDDFLEGVYGPGWTYIREYIDFIHALTENEDRHFSTLTEMEPVFDFGTAVQLNNFNTAYPEDLTADMIRNYEAEDWFRYWNFFSDLPVESDVTALIAKGREAFAKAYEAAETDSQKQEIDISATQYEYMELVLLRKRLNMGNTIKGYGGNAVGKIIRNFFKNNSDGFTMQERNTLINAIEQKAREQADKAYLALAAPFHEKASAYGVGDVWLYTSIDQILAPFDTER